VHWVVRGWDAIEEGWLHVWIGLVVRLLAGMAYAQVWAFYITEGHPRVSCCHSPCCAIAVGVIGVLKCVIGGCMSWCGGHNINTIHHRVMSICPTTSTIKHVQPFINFSGGMRCNASISHFSISQVRASLRVNLNVSLDLSLCPPLLLLSPSSSPPFPHPLTLPSPAPTLFSVYV
jgi:hypothetical protein